MSIAHGRLHVGVAENVLNLVHGHPVLHEPGRVRMSQSMDCHAIESGATDGLPDCLTRVASLSTFASSTIRVRRSMSVPGDRTLRFIDSGQECVVYRQLLGQPLGHHSETADAGCVAMGEKPDLALEHDSHAQANNVRALG